MTERWRKKLGDLDKQGPNDDVFERAKDGPMHLDQPLPGMKTSTRIATAVAAFAVFALAISVFAIPALRMQGTEAGSATSGLFPLWPSQTPDQLKQLQADADVGNAAWALDPKLVAERFAHDVMGWSDATVAQELSSSCAVAYGGSYPGQSSSPGYSPGDVPSSGPGTCVPSQADVQRCEQVFGDAPSAIPCTASFPPGTPECFAGCPAPSSLEAWLGSGSAAPSAGSSGGGGAFLTFFALPCAGGLNQCIEFGAERIIVFQPLQQGDGHIWAVMEARSDSITLSTAATQNVRTGASIGATSQYQRGIATLGYASCGATGGSSDGKNMAPGFSITLDTSLPASANCSGQQPGYAWGAQATTSLADGNGGVATDPLQGTSGVSLMGLTAVPIVMTFPDAEVPSTTEPPGPPTVSPTGAPPVDTVNWNSYHDPSGMTMDVPDSWSSHSIDNSQITGIGGTGMEFTGSGLKLDVFTPESVIFPADDSSFPLNFDSLLSEQAGVFSGSFTGNGQQFSIRVDPGNGGLTTDQEAIVRGVVGSITFPHLQPGTVTKGIAVLQSPVAQDQWMQVGDRTLILKSTPNGYIALGPVTCNEGGQPQTTWAPSATCPDDVTHAQWSATGVPAPGNAQGFQDPLDVHSVIRSWDGSLLVYLNLTTFPTVSPSPLP
jgi:hypothetical protein